MITTPETVELDFAPDGTMTVDLKGFHGQGCKSITDALKFMGTTVKEEKKPEFYERAQGVTAGVMQKA